MINSLVSARHGRTTRSRRLIAGGIVGLLLIGFIAATPVGGGERAAAADGRLFNAGEIISDAVFYDGGAMSSPEIQAFLVSQVPRCTSSYACLSTFRQNTPTMPAQQGRCLTYTGQPSESAADIIARVGQACGISQKAMLVLVQKEMSLVTLTNPSQGRFDSATGFGCPDTAACDPAVAGFFYQIYFAARQFKIYATLPTAFNYRAGQTNDVLFHPNRACGSAPVYISNLATAGLYNYTPYQPNAAALNNLYGTGDACSSYGNRNFFRIFSDWFGSPNVGSSLIQAVGSVDIWLVSGTTKHRVPTPSMLASLAVLGGVARVSAGLPGLYATGRDASNIVRAPNGAIYFHDAQIRLPMANCDLVVDYGGSCAPDGYTQLTDYQINRFAPGPSIGNLYATSVGGRYLIDGGVRREILDDRAQAAAGVPVGSYVRLTEEGIAGLPLGAPLLRDSVYIRDRISSQYYFFGSNRLHSIAQGTETGLGAPARVSGAISSASLARLSGAAEPFVGVVRAGGVTSVLTPSTRLTGASGLPPVSGAPIEISAELAGSYPLQQLTSGSFIKNAAGATISVVTAENLRPLQDWDTYRALSGGSVASWTTVSNAAVARIAQGQTAVRPGTLIRAGGDPRVYLVDGLSRLLYVDSFGVSTAAGVNGVQVVADGVLGSYARSGIPLGYVLRCGGSTWLSADGSLRAMSAEVQRAFGLVPLEVDSSTCALLRRGPSASTFIRTPDGAIFQVVSGQKRVVPSMARYLALDPSGSAFQNVDVQFAARLPSGPPA